MKFKVTYTETVVREIDITAQNKRKAKQLVSYGEFDTDDAHEVYVELCRVDSIEVLP